MSKFNRRVSTKTINNAGGFALKMSAEMELVHAVLSTFLDNKYYESSDERKDRIVHLIGINNPEFVSKLAIVARKEFNLRSVTTLLIGELAKIHRGDSLVKDTILACANRVDDLTELVSYLGTPLPNQVKRGIRNALLKFDRYQLAKYRGEGKGVSLVDVFNLVHPNPKHANKEQKKAWKDLMTGKLVSFDTWEVEFAAAKDEKSRKKAFEKLVLEDKMGYMALIRNLNNAVKYDLSEKVCQKIVDKLTDREEVKNSKQLPFRFYSAYKNVSGSRQFTNAVATAMDIAVDNAPELKGRTLIALDGSGSMSGDPIEKGSIFAATLMKSNPNADVIIYDTQVQEVNLTSNGAVVDIAQGLMNTAHGGGTNTSLVFAYASNKGKKYDRIIIISDNESWADYDSPQSEYARYKKNLDTDPFVYAIDIQGYGTKDVDGKKVFHLTGWSDRLLDFVGVAEKGESIVEYIKGYALKEKN